MYPPPSILNLSSQMLTMSNIANDIVLSIPILIIWPIKMPLRKKLVLLILFSMTLLIMAVAIIRVAVNRSSDRTLDITWLDLWCSVEVATGICLSCLRSISIILN